MLPTVQLCPIFNKAHDPLRWGQAMPVVKMALYTSVKAMPYRHAQRPVSSEILYLLRMMTISDHHRHFVPK